MPAKDLFRCVALYSFRPGIPSGDVALRIEHENRIVVYALDEEPKSFLAFAQSAFGFAAIGNIAKYQDNADNYAVVAANRSGTIIDRSLRAVFSDEQSMVCQTNNYALAQGPGSRILYRV